VRKTFIAFVIILCSFAIPGNAQRWETPGKFWRDCQGGGYCERSAKRPPTIVDRALSIPYAWLYVALIVAMFLLLLVSRAVQDRVGSLQGTAWELIRLMENTTPDGVRNRARVAEDTTEKFAVDGNARIMRSSLISTDQITPDLTAAGLTLMERHASEAAQFRAFRGALRNGIAIFLSVMVHRNTHSAFVSMTEYLKRQRDRKDAPSLAELKMFFGLPVDPPADDVLQALQKKGLSAWSYFIIGRAVSHRRQIFDGLEYHPPAPAPAVTTADDILAAMRTYLH
jgi:hypothetical protein